MGKPTKRKHRANKPKQKKSPPATTPPGKRAAPPPAAAPQSLSEKIFVFVRRVPVTSTILAVNGLVYLVSAVLGLEREFILWGASERSAIWDGELWRLATPIVLHAGVVHWLINSYALYLLGSVVERDLGKLRFLLLYLAAGVAGVAASVLGNDVLSVGASGAILGVFGAALGIKLFQPYSLFGSVGWRFFVVNGALLLGITFMGAAGLPIDNLAHFGGLVTGFLLGSLFALQRHPKQTPGRVKLLWGLAGAMLLLVLGLSAAASQRWPGMESRFLLSFHVEQAEEALGQAEPQTALERLAVAEKYGELTAEAEYLRAVALIRLERYETAEQVIARLLAHPHGRHLGLYARAQLREATEELPRAITDLEATLELAPTEWPPREHVERELRALREQLAPQTQPANRQATE